MKQTLLFFALLVIISACKKEDLKPEQPLGEDPIFSVVGSVDGQSVSFHGGVNGAYLETYTSVNNGVERFSGKLIEGTNYVDFGVFDGNLFLPESNISQAGNQLSLTLENTSTLIHIEKTSFSNHQNIQSIQISANGIDYGPKLTITEPGIYSICVTVNYNDVNSTQATICNEVVLGYKDLAPFELVHSWIQNGYLSATIIGTSSSVTVSSVEWYLDNVLISTANNLSGNITSGSHVLQAKVSFSNGVVKTRTVCINSGNEALYLQDFNVFKLPISVNAFQDFKAQFSLKLNGTTYKHIGNGGSDQVVITGISLYGKNAAHKDVYKVTGIIKCEMKNMSTNEISHAQFNVVFGLEIP